MAGEEAEAANEELRREVSALKERLAFLEKYYAKHASGEQDDSEEEEEEDEDAATAVRNGAIAAEARQVAELQGLLASTSFTASDAAVALQANVSFEYTADSPMFRRGAEAFEAAVVEGLGAFCGELAARTRRWVAKRREADGEAAGLGEWLGAERRRSGRALFSRAHGSLGGLSERAGLVAEALAHHAARGAALTTEVDEAVAARLDCFVREELGDVAAFRAETWRLGAAYERTLCDVLRRQAPAEETVEAADDGKANKLELERRRSRFEKARLALARYLNRLDARKKLALTEIFNDCMLCLGADPKETEQTSRALRVEHDRSALDDRLWDAVQDRLDAELAGELPPPGAPAGARCVSAVAANDNDDDDAAALVSSRMMAAARPPLWSVALTTEVLSSASAAASRRDLAHARGDGGVLKQGYLHARQMNALADGLAAFAFSQLGVAQATTREWHRLHNGALYATNSHSSRTMGGDDALLAASSTTERKVVDLRGATVIRGSRGSPLSKSLLARSSFLSGGGGALSFAFGVVTSDGHRLVFQAENDDELIQWVSALNRSTRGLRLDAQAAAIVGKGAAGPVDGPNAEAIDHFLAANGNAACADCASPDVEWVSTALGATLCADCATVHRKLGGTFSNLRGLWLDRWSAHHMLPALDRSAGNARVNALWEQAPPPQGWTKPTPDAPRHVKERWIVAKYRWRGFLADDVGADATTDDNHHHPDDAAAVMGGGGHPTTLLHRAAERGDGPSVAAAIAHRAAVDGRDPAHGNRTALHAAVVAGQADAATLLLTNGADPRAADDHGTSPLTMAASHDDDCEPHIAALILEHQQGDLW